MMVISELGNHLDLPDDIKTSDQAELYLFKADLHKLVEEWEDKADAAYANMEWRRYGAYRACAKELKEKLLEVE